MSNLTHIAFSHDLMVRGRTLAEGRMAFLTELYDSGRWSRYHSKSEFLTMVRESREALDKWIALAPLPSAPSAAIPATPKPLPTMFEQSEAPQSEFVDDPLAAALAAISMEMGFDQTELSAV